MLFYLEFNAKGRQELHQNTIKGGYRRAEKSRKVLMMMKAAKLWWAGPGAGQEQTTSRPGAGQEQCKSREEARVGKEHYLLTRFHPNYTENVEIKKICYWSALISWSSQSEK